MLFFFPFIKFHHLFFFGGGEMHMRKCLNMQILEAQCRNQSAVTHLLAHVLNFRNTNFQTEASQIRKLFYIHVCFFFSFHFETGSVQGKTLAEQRWSQARLKLTPHTSMHYDDSALLNICSLRNNLSTTYIFKMQQNKPSNRRSGRNLIGKRHRFQIFSKLPP